MKRSTTVSLVLLASVSAMASLSGCEQSPPAKPDNGGTFANKAECVAVYDQDTCDAADKLARNEHLQNAPKFNDRASCIAQFGADMCQPASAYGGGSNVFMPAMMGYMMGSAMSTPAPLYYGNRFQREQYGRSHNGSAPIFTSGRGFNNRSPIGAAPFASNRGSAPAFKTTKGSLKSSTAMTPPGSQRGGFGSSFKPTQSFKSTYTASNPTSFGRSTSSSFSSSPSSYSSRSSSSFSSRSSVSSRGGFGGSARGFGGGFGG
jgi:uncharacterized protein YgiB involved in biofilm formation